MAAPAVLFEFLGIQWTVLTIATAIAGGIPAIAALYKLYERWTTREERRHDMLRVYLDKEEKDISARRPVVLQSIQHSSQSYLTIAELDVGKEIDDATILLDRGHPEQAVARLMELEKRLERNESLLRKRADDLEKHKASVHIFIAALADKSNDAELGLTHIGKALEYDSADLDALKFRSILLLTKGDYPQAAIGFNRLRQNSIGAHNAGYRADAYLGLATIEMKGQPPQHATALNNLDNAIQNMNKLPPLQQDNYTRGQINRIQGDIYADESWSGTDRTIASHCYASSIIALEQIKLKRASLETEIEAIRSVRRRLQLLPTVILANN